jgi:hypothetical protein
MSSTRHVGDLEMSRYAFWNTSGEARLVHGHQKKWAHEPTTIAPIYTDSLIQALICCHVTNIAGRESPKGGTFFNTYAHECSWEVYKYCNTRINSQNNLNLGFENPWPVSTYDKFEHGHFDMIRSTGPILSKSCAPNNVMFDKVRW